MSRFALAVVALLTLVAASASAAPMTCTTEQKPCLTACSKYPGAVATNCIADCRQRFNYCRNTGCWDNGTSRYCGLLRK
jgi:hypothetical protein